MGVLLLGGSGQVGTELRDLARLQDVEIAAPGRDKVDLSDGASIQRVVGEAQWAAVINAAAYTDVDRAESERSAAFAINAEGPTRLAQETARRNIPLIHISTDYVFDGRKGALYVESDDVAPLNVYGDSKLAGEQGVRAQNPRHVVLRTAWVYSPFGRNFVKTILRLATERDRISIVADQLGCPTAARDIAHACLEIAERCTAAPDRATYGLYHFAGGGEASRFEFAQTIAALAADRLGKAAQVVKDSTGEYPTVAARPVDTRLDCSAVRRAWGLEPARWRDALKQTIDRLLIA